MAEEKKATQGEAGKNSNGRVSSAKKRHIQSKKRQARNRTFKSSVNTAIGAYRASISAGDKEASRKSLNAVYSLIDKGVKTGKFKMNKAARTKSRLTKHLTA